MSVHVARKRPFGLTILLCMAVAGLTSILTYGFTASRQHSCALMMPEEIEELEVGAPAHVHPEGVLGDPTPRFRGLLVVVGESKVLTLSPQTTYGMTQNMSQHGSIQDGVRSTLSGRTKPCSCILFLFFLHAANDVQSQGNLLYLAMITNRIPVLPPFSPSHIQGSSPRIPFGEVFDVPRLSRTLHMPILEWRDLKGPAYGDLEPLGCWSVWETMWHEGQPRGAPSPDDLALGAYRSFTPWEGFSREDGRLADISYTRVPDWVKMSDNDPTTTFWKLAPLAFPDGRARSLSSAPRQSPKLQIALPPDEQMLCFDYIYYVGIDGVSHRWSAS